jgi:hypothetical protein
MGKLLLRAMIVGALIGAAGAVMADELECRQDCRFRHRVDQFLDGTPNFRGGDGYSKWSEYQKCLEECSNKSFDGSPQRDK